MSHQIFVSYSRSDAVLIAPIVKLLRGTNEWVFLDTDDIQTGKQWREEISVALSRATLVIVFWCHHSRDSAEVKKEYRAAINARKDVMPVLLDSTTPPRALARYQWVDFREVLRGKHHGEGRSDEAAGEPEQPRTALNANILPLVIAGVLGSWVANLGWFNETISTIVGAALAIVITVIGLGIYNWLESGPSRPDNEPCEEARLLESEIRRRLGVTPSAK